MFTQTLLGLALISTVSFSQIEAVTPSASFVEEAVAPVYTPSAQLVESILAQHELDLTTRLPNECGSQVFADNILLALHYLKGDEASFKLEPEKLYHPVNMNWEAIREPFEVSFTLKTGEVFAYHANVLPEFNSPAGGLAQTMNSRFFMEEGYKALAGLGGNGVCHLASLMNWVASEAGLEVVAKANHDFYPVPGVPREFGTSIRSQSPNQNLYIRNGFEVPVRFEFRIEDQTVFLFVVKL